MCLCNSQRDCFNPSHPSDGVNFIVRKINEMDEFWVHPLLWLRRQRDQPLVEFIQFLRDFLCPSGKWNGVPSDSYTGSYEKRNSMLRFRKFIINMRSNKLFIDLHFCKNIVIFKINNFHIIKITIRIVVVWIY